MTWETWSLVSDLAQLLLALVFMVLLVSFALRRPPADLPRWKQSRYFRWSVAAFGVFVFVQRVMEIGHHRKFF